MLAERQRYVFAKNGAVRYGKKYNPANMQYIWNPLKEVREPVFCLQGYPGTFNNSYVCLNRNAIYKSDMRYCQLNNVPTIHDRDVNAAKNILSEGLRLLA